MASNRIKGITIEIDGNTKPLNDSLKSVDKSLKDTQTQLNDVNKLLKMDPGNVELLRQKQDLLTKAIGDTKTRQEELKKALEQAKQAGDTEENRKQQDLLQRELIETEQKLKGYENQMKEAGSATKGAGEAMDSAKSSAGNFGDVLKAKLTGEAIISGVKKLASSLKDLALGAAELSDELQTQSQVTGLSTDALQEYAYMSELVDVSVDTITGSMTKLTKSMTSASKGSGDAYEAFQKLGVSTTNLDGSLRDNEDVFNDLIDALGGIQNETERDAIAMTLFGKSAKELNPLINAGSKQLKAYAKEAHEVGYVMSEDVIKQNAAASDAIERFKKSAEAVKNSLGSALAPTITKVAEGMQKLVKWAQSNSDKLKNVAKVVGIAAAAFVSYKAIMFAIEAPTKAAAAAQALLNGTMVANPIVAVTVALAALATALLVFSNKTYEVGDDIKQLEADMDALTESVNEDVEAWDRVIDAQSRQTQNAEAEFAYYQTLADELSSIVDENGRVKEGYEERAGVISGILAEALGVEISLTDGVIQNYDTLKASIDEVIQKKKGELILKAQEEAYTEAVKARQDAVLKMMQAEKEKTRSFETLAKKNKELTEMQSEADRLYREGINDSTKLIYDDLLKRIEVKKQEVDAATTAADDAQAAYDKEERIVKDATYNMQLYEQNLAAVTKGEYDKIITANADVARSYEELDADSKAAMDKVTSNTAAWGADLYKSSSDAADDFVDGFVNGINSNKNKKKVDDAVGGMGNRAGRQFKYSLDEHSPSKLTEQAGEFFVQGFANGIKDAQNALFRQITQFGKNAMAAFATSTSGGLGFGGDVQYSSNPGVAAMTAATPASVGGVSVSVVVNGNVENYDELAETIGQKLQQQMAREGRAFA